MDSRTFVYVFNTFRTLGGADFTVRIERVDLNVNVKLWESCSTRICLNGEKLFPKLKDEVLTKDNIFFEYDFTLHPETKLLNNVELAHWAESNKEMILSEWSLPGVKNFYLPEEKEWILSINDVNQDLKHPENSRANRLAREKAYYKEVIEPTLQYNHRVKRVQKERAERKEKPIAKPKAVLIKAADLAKAPQPKHYKFHVRIK